MYSVLVSTASVSRLLMLRTCRCAKCACIEQEGAVAPSPTTSPHHSCAHRWRVCVFQFNYLYKCLWCLFCVSSTCPLRVLFGQAGCSLDNVVRTRMYVTDISNAEKVMAEHCKVFSNIRPAATLISVSLCGLHEYSSLAPLLALLFFELNVRVSVHTSTCKLQ